MLNFYRFVHRFVRDYIYDSKLVTGKKRILHQQVGECLEVLYTDRNPIAGQLAMHFRIARQHRKAAEYAWVASQVEQAKYAWLEVKKWCTLGLEQIALCPNDQEIQQITFDLLERLGDAQWHLSEYKGASANLQAAMALTEETPIDAARQAHLCYLLADAYELAMTQNSGQGYEALERALRDSEKLPQTTSLKRARAEVYDTLGTVQAYLNRYSEAIESYSQSIQLAKDIGYKSYEPSCWCNIADMHWELGEVEQCMAYIDKALEVAKDIGNAEDESYAYATRGGIWVAIGKPTEGKEDLSRAKLLAENEGALDNCPYILSDLALAELALSDLDAAYRDARLGVQYAKKTRRSFELGYAYNALAQVESAMGKARRAAAFYEQAIRVFQQAGNRHYQALAQRDYAEHLFDQNENAAARQLLDGAMTAFDTLGLAHEKTKVLNILKTHAVES